MVASKPIPEHELLAILLALGAPALAAWIGIAVGRTRWTVEIYAGLLGLCMALLLRYLGPAVAISPWIVGTSVVGLGLGYGLFQVESRLRSAARYVSQRNILIYVGIAILEELFYRHVLLDLVNGFGAPYRVGLVGLVLWFAAIHVESSFIWKLPLSLGLVLIAVASGSVLPAMTAHVAYNISVIRHGR